MPSNRFLGELAWTQLWQFTLVAIAIGLITRLACRRRPHLAYALWMVVLVKGVTPPLWTSNFSAFGRAYEPPAPAWLTEAGSASDTREAAVADPHSDRSDSNPDKSTTTPLRSRSLPTWFSVWLIGAAGLSVWAVAMIVRRNRLLAAASSESALHLDALVATAAQELGVHPAPEVVISPSGMGPAVCGVIRPKLVLPGCIVEQSTAEQLRPIITHELLHLRRGDQLVAVLQFVFQAIWWFHPLAWWANRTICRIRELCCDAETVSVLDEPPKRYAQTLVEVLEAKHRLRPVFGFPGVRPVEVTAHRIKEVLSMSDRFLARTSVSSWLAALVAAFLLLPGGRLLQATADDKAAPATNTKQTVAKDAAAKPLLLLKYGDGKPDGKKSIAGSGEMIRFQLPKGQTNALKALRVHGSRYGYPQPPKEDVEITILTEDMKEPVHTELVPYALFKRQQEARWMQVPFDEPVDVPATFWVVLNFNAERTKGVYVSYDTSSKGEHSRVGFNDEDAKETDFKGDWMVQAVLAK